MLTKEDIEQLKATLATKDDLTAIEQRLNDKIEAVELGLRRELVDVEHRLGEKVDRVADMLTGDVVFEAKRVNELTRRVQRIERHLGLPK